MGDEKVFIPHATECWAPASMSGVGAFKLLDPCDLQTTEDLKQGTYDKAEWAKLKALPMLSTLPPFEEAKKAYSPIVDPLEGKDNVAELQLVSEGSVIHSIRHRYLKNLIYTNVGRIVIAMNPFQGRPDLYNDQQINCYAQAQAPHTLTPHVYQIAAGAYNGVRDDAMNQSTLITGESGAGKTESTKLLLRFFATLNGRLGQSKSSPTAKASIEDRIVMANPILEAFGNASTSRNPNSSRFGKWIEICFDARMKIGGASITNYMLEMPRVCEHLHCDRAYHIFYQVATQREKGDFLRYKYLTPTPAPPGVVTKGHGKTVNDKEMYEELLDALKDYEFTANEQTGLFSLVSAVLSLGNIKFNATSVGGGEGSAIDGSSDKDVKEAATLIGCDEKTLRGCLTFRKLTIGKDVTEVPLKPVDALGARNSLAKLIYGSLFNWLISRINAGLVPAEIKSFKTIGILDIAGFERFDVNSYEQLLINLSNEKLQQRFNQDIIQAEVEDYKKEGLVDLQIDYADNTAIIALVEGKGGLIDTLDEELFVPKGSDAGFAGKVAKAHAHTPNFAPPKFAGEAGFSVSHFAGVVPYTVSGWLDKNRLAPPREAFETLNSAHNNVVKQMVALIVTDTKKQTVGSNFRKQLEDLLTKIRATKSQYVRCVKPNSLHKPGGIESHEMLRQLKCAGIMEAIKIRKSGFSLRISFADFVERYAILVGIGKPKTKETCSEIIALAKTKAKIGEKDILLATSKVMARDSVRELLDKLRVDAVEELKRPLLPFIKAYETAMDTQGGMFLFPMTMLPDVTTPQALEKQRGNVEAALKDVEKKLGTLDNPPSWVGTAIQINESMKKEISIVTSAITVLDKIKPLSCDDAIVNQLQDVQKKAGESNVINATVDKVVRVLGLIAEEKDWVVQLNSADTDQEELLKEIKGCGRDILTPACHKLVAEIAARIESAKTAKKKQETERLAAEAKAKAEAEAHKAVKEVETTAITIEKAAATSSEKLTRADTVLQKVPEPPKMPPAKLLSVVPGTKAYAAHAIAKKALPTQAEQKSLLEPRPRVKSKAPPPKKH